MKLDQPVSRGDVLKVIGSTELAAGVIFGVVAVVAYADASQPVAHGDTLYASGADAYLTQQSPGLL